MDKGASLHEEHRLINNIKGIKVQEGEVTKPSYLDYKNEAFFKDVRESKLIYSGHQENNKGQKYFINKDIGFIGQPDYIFKNPNGNHFIVEEKFKRFNGKRTNHFKNHKIQLASYIYYLIEFKIDYGYLVYWIYDYQDYWIGDFQVSDLFIKECIVLEITRSAEMENKLTAILNNIKEFKKNETLNLDLEQLNPRKCAACVHNIICGHKNKRINKVSLPYSPNYFKLYPAVYPDILKKQDK